MPYTIFTAVKYLIDLLELAIFVTVIFSWLPVKQDNKLIRFVNQITEPIMAPIRHLLQKLFAKNTKNMMIDFSPVVAILLLELVKGIVYNIVIRF